MNFKAERIHIAIAGGIIGMISVALVLLGNPANMGFCLACFIRDTAGGLGLHRAEAVQYIRPEVIGLVLGAMILSMARGEFAPRGGSAPVTRFFIAFFVMVGALMFLGCPFRMVLRLAGGDLNAVVGLIGFVVGIAAGVFFLKNGYSLKRTYKQTMVEGLSLPIVQIVLLILLVSAPAFIFFTAEGPGAKHAAVIYSLGAGLIVGALAQYTRLCMVGGFRDIILFREPKLLIGFCMIFLTALIGNLIFGKFHLGFADQPVAHTDSSAWFLPVWDAPCLADVLSDRWSWREKEMQTLQSAIWVFWSVPLSATISVLPHPARDRLPTEKSPSSSALLYLYALPL